MSFADEGNGENNSLMYERGIDWAVEKMKETPFGFRHLWFVFYYRLGPSIEDRTSWGRKDRTREREREREWWN